METIRLLLGALWIIWLIYWFLSSLHAKRSIKNNHWRLEAVLRISIILTVIFLFRIPFFSQLVKNPSTHWFYTNLTVTIIGFLIFLSGFVLSIWARITLSDNWGMPMTTKEHPVLITAGPYAIIRHPIYTGMILSMFGTTIAVSIVWLIPFILICFYFLYSLTIEEQNMQTLFPKEYTKYKKRTKNAFPFYLLTRAIKVTI